MHRPPRCGGGSPAYIGVIISEHSFQDRVAKLINKISHSTGPYSPDQGGPPDKTSGVEASCILLYF
eukprot:scaffold9648_cov37-Phaeocystis_antarctica.AAC.1